MRELVLGFHAAVAGISGFWAQADLNIFGGGGNLSLWLGSIPSPNFNAFLTGLTAGSIAIAAAFVAIWLGVPTWSAIAGSIALAIGIGDALIIGHYASSDPHWRSGYFLGILVATLFFVGTVTGIFGIAVLLGNFLGRFGINLYSFWVYGLIAGASSVAALVQPWIWDRIGLALASLGVLATVVLYLLYDY